MSVASLHINSKPVGEAHLPAYRQRMDFKVQQTTPHGDEPSSVDLLVNFDAAGPRYARLSSRALLGVVIEVLGPEAVREALKEVTV
jgi:hypothetical protein